jgi:hypothetical protein
MQGSREQTADVFEIIRQRSQAVASDAKHVHIAWNRIGSYAETLPRAAWTPRKVDIAHHYVADEATTLAYFVTLDAVNFGSGYFPHLAKRPGMSGYYTVATRLADRFRRQGPLCPEDLALFGPTDSADLLGQPLTDPVVAELMRLYAEAWNALGRELLHRYDGSFARLIEEAEQSAARLISILDRQPFFHDVFLYDGAEVPFYKRAQILASDLALAFDRVGPGRFDDLDRLTLFADNLVPHVLRVDGLLTYEDPLADAIRHERLIPSGSEEEIEIRACALHVVELIATRLRSLGRPVSSRDLDIFLWERGQAPQYKRLPRHRTRCVYY